MQNRDEECLPLCGDQLKTRRTRLSVPSFADYILHLYSCGLSGELVVYSGIIKCSCVGLYISCEIILVPRILYQLWKLESDNICDLNVYLII